MLKKVRVKNFKCFEEETLELSNLNLLSGINSMGKSTFIQALLLIRQAKEQGALGTGLYLNGMYVNLGNGRDILYRDAVDEQIEIDIMTTKAEFKNQYTYKGESDFLTKTEMQQQIVYDENDFNLLGKGFEYIAADRLGPQSSYQKSYYEVHEQQRLGNHGEYAVHYLYEHGLEKVENVAVLHPKKTEYPEETEKRLLRQVEKWMGEITPGVSFRMEDYGHSNRIGLTVHQESTTGAEYFSVENVGFGISYVLPVVLAVVKAKAGELVILENPEAHLHPAGQRKMGELIARAASGGVQLIVETHSDHVLNGIRLSVKKNLMDSSNVCLNYFTRQQIQQNMDCRMVPIIQRPMLKEDGRLNFWPDGFFDEWDKAIDELF